MSNLATLCHDEATSTWTAEYNGEVLVKSIGGESSKQYVIDSILQGKRAKAIKLGVTGFTNFGTDNLAPSPETGLVLTGTPWKAPKAKKKANNNLTVLERFELLDENVRITATCEGIRSLIITGEGSVGKTWHTKEMLKSLGLLSTQEAFDKAHTLTEEEQMVADAILLRMEECKQIAIKYYEKNGLPKPKTAKKPKSKGEDDDGDNDDDDGDDEEDEREFKIEFGKVDFTKLHTSQDIRERCKGACVAGKDYFYNIKLAVANPHEYLFQIVPHEIAHQIQHIVYPEAKNVKEGHGKEWCLIMKEVFGISPDRFHTMDTSDVRLAPDLAGDYHYVKGYTSAKGLFRCLFENKKKIVVFDDCDAAWQNEVSANILKAALDTDEDRWITWNTEVRGNDDLPRQFLFEGKVIFISNVKSEDFPQALVTRALRCDIEMTIEERFERMSQILYTEKFAPRIPHDIRKIAYEFLYENREIATEISTRALLNVCEVANTGSRLWKRIALSNIT